MPRVYLKFEIPQETEEYELAYNGAKYKYALDELDEWLRNTIKYDQGGDLGEARLKVLQEVRDKLNEITNELT
jgi:hypothetical protein